MKFLWFVVLLFEGIWAATFSTSQHRNLCLEGVNTVNLNHKQRAFNDGVCSPVILVPGFLATSLVVQIDCEVLRNNSPSIFSACGWNSCNRSVLAKGSAPRSEYRLWIGEPLTKFFPIQGNLDKCLGELLKFEDRMSNYEQPKGLKVTWFGNTPQSMPRSNCGASAIRDISGNINTLRHCALDGFAKTIDMLEDLGYESGISFQAIPYDFRFSAKASEASNLIIKSIHQLTKNTGKKVVLVGHSFGSVHILEALSKLALGEKTRLVAEYISIGAPFLGSAKAVKEVIAWDESLIKKILNIEVGFGCHSQRMLALNSGSIVNFLPRTDFGRFAREQWFKGLMMAPPTWLPSYKNFSFVQLRDYIQTRDLIEIADSRFSGKESDFRKLFSERQNKRLLQSLEEGFENDPHLFHLDKPDVPTTVIFSARYPTESKYSWKDCKTISECSSLPNVTEYLAGDETVTVISAVLPALKWIAEKNQGGVKLVEYGGAPGPISPYYSTLNISCSTESDAHCRHPCMHQDDSITSYLFERLLKAQRISRGMVTHCRCNSLLTS